MAESEPIDWPKLHTRCLNDAAFVLEMAELFRKQARLTHEELRAAVEARDISTAKRHAHTLKGSAANLSAEPLRAAAANAELLAKEGDLDAVRGALPSVDTEMQRCLAAIDRQLAAK